jgi:polyhydroxyalkanoate synthesis regulator phasin
MKAKTKIDQLIAELVKGGKVTAEEGERIFKKFWKDTEDERTAIKKGFKKTAKKIERKIDFPTREEFENLKKRVAILEKK